MQEDNEEMRGDGGEMSIAFSACHEHGRESQIRTRIYDHVQRIRRFIYSDGSGQC